MLTCKDVGAPTGTDGISMFSYLLPQVYHYTGTGSAALRYKMRAHLHVGAPIGAYLNHSRIALLFVHVLHCRVTHVIVFLASDSLSTRTTVSAFTNSDGCRPYQTELGTVE